MGKLEFQIPGVGRNSKLFCEALIAFWGPARGIDCL